MRQELSLKQELSVHYSLVLGVSLGSTSLGDEVKSIFLTVDHFGEFQTRPQSFLHVSIVWAIKTHPIQDVLVTQTIESSEQNCKRDRLLDQWDGAVDALVIFD